MSHTLFNVTAYACVLSGTFSLQEDMVYARTIKPILVQSGIEIGSKIPVDDNGI